MSWSYYDFLLIVGKGTLEIRSDWAAKNFNSSTVISGLFKSQTLNICFSCIGEYELFLINHAHNKGSYLLALGWEGKDIAFFFTVSRLLIYNFFFTAAPILIGDNQMRDLVVSVGKKTTFRCEANSLPDELPPTLPIWKKNGMDLVIDGGCLIF